MSFCFWLISLCITDCRSIHITTNDLVTFLFIAEYTYYIFIHSSIDGYLGCVHILAIISSAAMNIAVQVLHILTKFIISEITAWMYIILGSVIPYCCLRCHYNLSLALLGEDELAEELSIFILYSRIENQNLAILS